MLVGSILGAAAFVAMLVAFLVFLARRRMRSVKAGLYGSLWSWRSLKATDIPIPDFKSIQSQVGIGLLVLASGHTMSTSSECEGQVTRA
jgi:hypothetical protein